MILNNIIWEYFFLSSHLTQISLLGLITAVPLGDSVNL